jgi:hypothetical protein
MSFGSHSGPPATAKQVAYLESLVRQAGFTGFAEARHPLHLTARQARGKFSRTEASDLIDRLTGAAGDEPAETVAPAIAAPPEPPPRRPSKLSEVPAEVLAGELERRGWTVLPPG